LGWQSRRAGFPARRRRSVVRGVRVHASRKVGGVGRSHADYVIHENNYVVVESSSFGESSLNQE
jgi:hypothetical protein